jgi:serine/threonine protein kinase
MTDAGVAVGPAPGSRLDDRYWLRRINRWTGAYTVWQGWDDLLRRPVAVQVFSTDPPPPGVFGAVRAACQVTHAGLPQVFDANNESDPPYFVREWVRGRDLTARLDDGPLEPQAVAAGFLQASEALAAAHAVGLSHLRLTPRSLVWSRFGGVKVLGLGVDAAVERIRVDDPELVDTRALVRLLCAALSVRYRERSLLRSSWSRATRGWWIRNLGTGRELLGIAHRSLSLGAHRSDAIRTPDQLADELRQIAGSHRRGERVAA